MVQGSRSTHPSLSDRGSSLAYLALALLLAACSPFPKEVKKEVQNQPSFAAIQSKPSVYRHRPVMLGGTILYAKHRKHGTYLEVLEQELNAYDRPIPSDKTGGRFLVGTSSLLDLKVYSRGRDITIVGRVVGSQPGRIGERPYTYPLIAATDIHLWREHVEDDHWKDPRVEWGWGYPGMDWGMGWPMMPPMTFW
ncbi:Slp family lipoprotein [Methylacidimicrobium tartarophylax]|uniref:Outer membrane protein slp n=1 Tax=Methylacidimicrobium tartarophylax TaxID=1041768 RepID=A0A5E6MAD2_9BACT|nr:Slp family lipoprotein [Methylacidimicrobium tartarophylax]VVM04714.1 Outer membrane protein slp [Methylacidimicrobium tartarophylax]